MSNHEYSADTLWVLEVEPSPEQCVVVEEILDAHEQPYAVWEHRETGRITVRIYCETEAETDRTEACVRAWLKTWAGVPLNPLPDISRRTILREDWSESWKKHFHTDQVSEHIVIKPSWEDYTAADGEIVLEIDPGMSFGTGQHGTTRACLQFMDELRPELGAVSFLDAGCGSGILSLAACELGYHPVYGFDNDPAAVSVARDHLQGCSGDINIECSTIEAYAPPQPCRLVVANILAVVLLSNAEQIISFLRPAASPSVLILSGILEKQYPQVKSRFTDLGLQERSARIINEWKSGCFVLK